VHQISLPVQRTNNRKKKEENNMCGIGAFQIVNNEVSPAKVAKVLARLLQSRGRDASGVAWHSDGSTWVNKSNVAGEVLARTLGNDVGTTGIVHTRWATQGNPLNNDNNHPIDVGGIIGVHNGHISNDNALISRCVDYKRCAQVDSEAAFAFIAHAPEKMSLVERLAEIRGGAALLWLDSYDATETLHAARVTSSPLVLGQTAMGSIVFASTEAILQELGKRCEMHFDYVHHMEEATYMKIQHGRIADMLDIPVPKKPINEWSYRSTLFDDVRKHDYSKSSKYTKK
jgi:glucosamine 6-phosphate synthetase-like amidotransferase/phosphosugar isomerase protein